MGRKRLFSDPRDFQTNRGLEMEDYKNFVKKQCLPKNMRGVNLKLLELNTRTNSQNLTEKMITELPENKKKMIDMKYDLKKMKTRLVSDKMFVTSLKPEGNQTHKKSANRKPWYKQTTQKPQSIDEKSELLNKSSVADLEDASMFVKSEI